jgi:hypothetical protein
MNVEKLEIKEDQLIIVETPRESYDFNLLMELALIDIKTISGLKVLLYLTLNNSTILTLKEHQRACGNLYEIDKDSFYEGLEELYNIGYIKQNGDLGWFIN